MNRKKSTTPGRTSLGDSRLGSAARCTRPGSYDPQDAKEMGELFDRRKTDVR